MCQVGAQNEQGSLGAEFVQLSSSKRPCTVHIWRKGNTWTESKLLRTAGKVEGGVASLKSRDVLTREWVKFVISTKLVSAVIMPKCSLIE